MREPLLCPVCGHWVIAIEKWKGIYLCTLCRKKYEKIEALVKEGQVLDHQSLQSILRFFGEKEISSIKASSTVFVKKKRGRPNKDKTAVLNIVAPKRRKKKI